MKKNLNNFIMGFCSLLGSVTAQTSNVPSPATASKGFLSQEDIFGTRNFIENKGQFVNPLDRQEGVLFVYDHAGEKIYFTPKGLIYEQVKRPRLTEEQRERLEQGEELPKSKPQYFYIRMSWVNPATNITIDKQEKQSHYLTYGSAGLNSSPFKKITYKNVYNNIDIEYTIPADKKNGIKYNVILHPGADASLVKILYSGDVLKVRKNSNGEVLIKTKFEDIVEHLPSSFQSGQPLASEFLLNRDTIMFNFPAGYKQGETVIIDPWVSNVTSLGSSNSAYDVDFDNNGNVFVYGGTQPYKIAMYNSSGVLQWTFAGTVSSPSWMASGSSGNFAVEKGTGKCFTGQGGQISQGAQVIRLDASGNYDNFITTATTTYKEIWDMGFHCSSGELFIFGGTTSSSLSAATVNSVAASLNLTNFQPGNTMCCQDVVTYAIDDLGAIFILYATASSPSLDNHLCAINSSFNGNLWTQPSNFPVMFESDNKNAYQPYVNSNGFNALAVNSNYLFYYDGFNLAAYSKATGTSLAATTIPLHTLKAQGGIVVDNCNNIYIGGVNSILTYSFNGTTFSTLTPITLSVSTFYKNVYDLKLDRSSNTLYYCGSGFVGTIGAGANCQSGGLAVTLTPSTPTTCPGQSVSLVATGASNYTWSTGSNAATIVVTPTVTTSYTITGKTSNSCANATGTAIITVSTAPAPSVTVNTPTMCIGETRKLTATGATTYSWNTGATTASININPTVTTSYTVVGTSTAFPCPTKKVVAITVNICKDIAEVGDHQLASIYPNPTRDKLNIVLTAPAEKSMELRIYSTLGQLVFFSKRLSFSEEGVCTIDVSDLPSGLYVVNLVKAPQKQLFRLVKD